MGALSRQQTEAKIKAKKAELVTHQKAACSCNGPTEAIRQVGCERNQINLKTDIGILIRSLERK